MSQTSSFRLSEHAQNDLENIWHYTFETWSLQQAEAYTNDILEICQAIPEGVAAVRPYPFDEEFYLTRSGSHYIYFAYEAEGVLIVRILHGSQDPSLHI